MLPSIPKPRKALILLADLEGGLAKVAKDLQNAGTDVVKVAFNYADYYYELKYKVYLQLQ